MSEGSRGLEKLLGVPRDVGHPVPDAGRILDLGCGNGSRVQALIGQGYRAAGCDFRFKAGPNRAELERGGLIRLIATAPYRLPFDDAEFDFVFSEQVFEHVRNWDETLAEIRRVLRPGGTSLHVFPSRLRPIEGHVHVPLASVFRPYPWLLLWAALGVRKPSQRGMNARDVALANRSYLDEHTHYLGHAAMVGHIRRHFPAHRFCEREALRYSRLRGAWPLLRRVPGLGPFLHTFQTRVLLLVRSGAGSA